MTPGVYKINKGINQPVEFRGLKAQYIGYLAAGLVCLLVFFAILYIAGINTYLCLAVTGTGGSFLFMLVYRASRIYGQYGLMKKIARRNIPSSVIIHSRTLFTKLCNA